MEIFQDQILALLHFISLAHPVLQSVHNGFVVFLFENFELSDDLLVSFLDTSVHAHNLSVYVLLELGQRLLDFVDQGLVLHCH